MRVASPLRHLLPHSSHPAPTRGHTLGAPRLYDAFADLFFFGRRHATFQALVAAAGVRSGQRVLDVGCGTGYWARLLARAVGPDGLVVGIDPSPEMIAYASRKAGPRSTCRFQVGMAEALDLPADHFDVVVNGLMLHHLPEDLRVPALREMRRVLRPGGTLLVAEARIFRHGLNVPNVEPLVARAGFAEIRSGEAPLWLSYVHAVKTATAG